MARMGRVRWLGWAGLGVGKLALVRTEYIAKSLRRYGYLEGGVGVGWHTLKGGYR